VTSAQRRALEGVRNREVALDRLGSPAYDGREIAGVALAACRRKGWTTVNLGLGPHGRLILTAEGEAILRAAPDTPGGGR
jgi:hypothetical protein